MIDQFRWSRKSWHRNELTKAYEPVQPLMLARMAQELESFTFFDVGANIGAYSMLMAALSNVQRVLAFEPQPDCMVELRHNIRLNRCGHLVTPHPIALSDRAGEAVFRKTGSLAGDSGLTSTLLDSAGGRGHDICVPIGRLDDVLPPETGAIVIKIDVEGHEIGVLRGAEKLMRLKAGFLQIEIHEQSPCRAQTEQLLRDYGWNHIVSVHWDHFYTNLPQFCSETARMALIQNTLSHLVAESLSPVRPWRRQLAPGVVIECRRATIRNLYSILTLSRFRRAG